MKQINLKSNSEDFWNYLIFFIWPLLGLLVSIRKFYLKSAGICIVLFYGIFGYTILFNESNDSTRHKTEFESIALKPFSDFFQIIFDLFSSDGKPDFFMNFVAFLVSRLTDDYHLYFMLLAVLIGSMLVLNFKVFYKSYQENKNKAALLFIIFFLVILPPVRIMSFRHYFALLVFVYGLYHYFLTDKKYYLVLLTSVIFIHFGFLMIVPLFFFYLILGNKNWLYLSLIILSFIFYEEAANWIKDTGFGFEGGLNQAIVGYTNENYLKEISVIKTNRLLIVDQYVRWTVLFFFISTLYHKYKYKAFDVVGERLFSLSLLLFAFVNFMQGLESVSNRFGLVYQAICCIFFIHLYTKSKIKYSLWFFFISMLFLGINFIVILRTSMEFTNVLTITPFSLLSIIMHSDVSVLDLIK